jgi:pilus assembly protein CpaB
MKSKSLILMFVSLGFGLIAAIGISQVMGKNKGPAEPAKAMTPVLVAVDHLDLNAKLNGENVKIDHWPAEIVPEDAIAELTEIEDQAVTTRVARGMPILRKDLIPVNQITRLPIPPGFRVVAIKVSASDTINGLLAPGDHVDVIGVFRVRDEFGQSVSVSRTFMKNVKVFSVDDSFHSEGPREAGNSKNNSIVGVLVNTRQSEHLVLVQKVAQLKLALRGNSIDDDEDIDLADMDEEIKKLMGGRTVDDEGEDENGGGYHYTSQPADGFTVRVWNGSDMEEFVHGKDGSITREGGEATPFGAPNSEDSADNSGPRDLDSDLEEDQYPEG